MEKYRKPDQYYIDEYDKRTILLLKELESKEATERSAAKSFEEKQRLAVKEYVSFDSFYYNAVMRARDKKNCIQSAMQRDENRDRLVAKYVEPQNITCKTCNSLMFVNTHLFKEGQAEILFVFECPNGHPPRRAFYPNGKEFLFSIKRCETCKGELQLDTRENKKKLKFIETCKKCGSKKVDEIDIPQDDAPIDENDRQKYCTAYINRNMFLEDLKEVAELAKSFEEQKKEKKEVGS